MFWTYVFYFLFILFNFYDTLSFSKILPWENLGGPERTKIFDVVRGAAHDLSPRMRLPS